MADSPYPELKKSHTMARTGRPWTDVKPPPAAPVWRVIQGFADYWVLVAAIELGMFDALEPSAGTPRASDDIAAALGLDPSRTEALLDALVAMGFVEEVAGGGLVLSDAAARYLTTDGAASMVELVAVANGPRDNWPALADTVRKGVPPAPVDDDPAFYRPLVAATFPTQLRAATRLFARIGLSRRPGLRLLDLGAGAAPWAIAALQASEGSTAVVNDLPDVIELAEERLALLGLTDRTELRAGDYRTIELEHAAYDVVVLGHVLRAEGADGAPHLLARARAALAPGGQLIVADYFRGATRTANPFAALMGATIVASTRAGDTFTGPQLVAWLHAAGFARIRLHEPIGGQQAYVAELDPPRP
jgi:ubiquinone/menaquinone biosynthesis C-methylase UbiE